MLLSFQTATHVKKEIVEDFPPEILRITPTYIVSMGVNDVVELR